MLDAAARAFFHSLAQVGFLQRMASRYGMATERGFARRFVAGESIEEAIAAVRGLAERGLRLTLDYLGERAATMAEADRATREHRDILAAIVASGIERNVSVKLTQLGLLVDRATAIDNLRRILDPATEHGFFVRLDMEGSAYTDETLRILETLWGQGYHAIGVALQAYLLRTEVDIRRVNALGARIRLVKGAYHEPRSIAYRKKADVDAAFVRLMRLLLDECAHPALATDDPRMIDAARAYAAERGYAKDRFEFQFLYGVRRDLQASLASEGYRVRIDVPFGRLWFPYVMRRLGERPANLGFVVRNVLRP